MNLDSMLNEKFIEAVKAKIPNKTDIAKFVTDTLLIGKEAVYRRLRGDVPFTFNEIVILSQKLNISIDSIAITLSPDHILFELGPVSNPNLQEADIGVLEDFLRVFQTIKDENDSEMVYASNMFPQFIFTDYYHLSKLHTFKWQSQQELSNLNTLPFHLMDYPEDLHQIKIDIRKELKQLKRITYIWDNMVFRSTVNDIKYFHSVNLITDEDVKILKEELFYLLQDLEEVAIKGALDEGGKINIYVSEINIDATYAYIKSKMYNISLLGVFAMNYLTSMDKATMEKMRSWAQSQKKVSISISESGEIQRRNFFKAQYEIINSL